MCSCSCSGNVSNPPFFNVEGLASERVRGGDCRLRWAGEGSGGNNQHSKRLLETAPSTLYPSAPSNIEDGKLSNVTMFARRLRKRSADYFRRIRTRILLAFCLWRAWGCPKGTTGRRDTRQDQSGTTAVQIAVPSARLGLEGGSVDEGDFQSAGRCGWMCPRCNDESTFVNECVPFSKKTKRHHPNCVPRPKNIHFQERW